MITNLPRQLEQMLEDAVARQASDFFLVPGEPPTLRVQGRIARSEAAPLSAVLVEAIAAEVLGKDSVEQIGRQVAELHRSFTLAGGSPVCVSVARAAGACTIAVQIFIAQVPSLEMVRFPQPILDALLERSGLVVFSGFVGSGKTTSAYVAADYVNAQRPCRVCTVEETIIPITPKKALVQQREVGVDVPNTLAGIHAAMRQDFDVLLVTEVKTVEELEACLTAAETGHLVIIVLHATSPADAVQRMLAVFPPEMREGARRTLAQQLRVVSTQRLLPKIGGRRVAAYAVLTPDDEMRRAIASEQEILVRKAPLPEGCRTLAQRIGELEQEGLITKETAENALRDP